MTRVPVERHPGSVAIIGMAARLPGARTIEEFWWNLREGVESVVRHSREEMLANGARPDLVDDPNYVNASAPLDDGDTFDAEFFGYSTREASIMEPQHRIFLECAYHALEDAAYDSHRFPGLIGVFGGSTMNTYILHNVMPHSADVVTVVGDLQVMIGNDKDYLTTRVSHKLDLRGPSIAVQTACSTSLVAVHVAARALLDDECDMALAGGSSLRMPHAAGYLANPGGTASADGHCRAFDADAAGSVVGSGVGVVVLKRLPDALRDGDRIHAVIRGSAISNDGRTKASFTAPSVDGQARAVVGALRRAGVSAREISLVEAHGTGTPLGDPIEVAALTRAFRETTDDRGYCWLGSAKPNIGHLDAAAGVAGLIKTVLALKHRRVPPVVNFRSPNPKLGLESSPFRVATELTPFDTDEPLVASINSLAMGGTNVHVVVEEAPRTVASEPSKRRRHPVLLSARSGEALERLGQSLGRWARENPTASVADVAHTLAVGRRDHEIRRAVLATDLDDVAMALSTRGSRRQREQRTRGSVRTAFLFPGQGEQFPGMAVAAAREPTVAAHLDTVIDLFADLAGRDLRPLLTGPIDDREAASADLARTEVTQPALFAVEWALGRTLLDYGVRPYAMLGHSVGELVGATLCGVMDLETAVRLVGHRGEAMAATPEGAMLYVNLTEDEVVALLPDDLDIAAVNAQRLVVVSGADAALTPFEERLRAEGVSCGRLGVNRGFHSALMDQAVDQFRDVVAGYELSDPTSLLVSNVYGRYLEPDEARSPDYWANQIRRPVRYADGLGLLVDDGVTVFVEIGPGRTLSRLAATTSPDAVHLGLVGGEADTPPDLLEVLTDYWLTGGDVDWSAWYGQERRARISLPGYPFARTRHWLEPKPPQAAPAVATASAPPPVQKADKPAEFDGTPMQRYVAWLWRVLLGRSDFGLHDSFFEVGGHSLLAMQMVSQLRKHGAGDLEMTDLFELPTVAGLAEKLESLGVRPPAHDEDVAPHTDEGPRQQAVDDELDALLLEVEALSDEEVRARLVELEKRGEV
ncbi:type I polyketide synthase [Actinophytocola xanthii]|uniref:Beta-ketoacyl synthase n=1 Tax=Actinophytocola xanthii TaxID=1912961 RepID=A0A1Q8CK24_9PSEU|nr:type I polyketide synthase [Actinophytocola xanthii]OLF14717.1 beta-ketoacyl synthase [Actinophytocola xanthii]